MDKKLISTLETIHKSGAFDDIALIYITGSVGRANGELPSYLNDVDLLVVGSSFSPSRKIATETQINKLFDTRFSDIDFIEKKKFLSYSKQNNVTQYIFDLFNEGYMVYADNTVNIVPISRCVILDSAAGVLATRIWAKRCDFRNVNDIRYQHRKFISAIIDAVLIINRSYQSGDVSFKLELLKKISTSHYEFLINELKREDMDSLNCLPFILKKFVTNLTLKEKILLSYSIWKYKMKTLILKDYLNYEKIVFLKECLK